MKRWYTIFPCIAGFLLALFFVFTQPGSLTSDAGEYDALAHSILTGRYSLDGAPSMLREPGYPAFRAVLTAFHAPLVGILVVQALLFAVIVWLVGDAVRRMEPKIGSWGMWAAACAYGLAIYAARHLLELFTAFLLALVAWCWMRGIETPTWKWRVLTIVTAAALLLTRMSFMLIPVVVILVFAVRDKLQKDALQTIAVRALVSLVLLAALLAPWIIRNGRTFGAWSITQRAGITLYARSLKAEAPWSTLGQSALSVIAGRSVLARVYPLADPIIIQHWKDVWPALATARANASTDLEADALLKSKAIGMITSSPTVFMRYMLWSGVDAARFLQFPSPLSPEFSVEGMFVPQAMQGPLSMFQWTMLVAAAVIQLGWWSLIVISFVWGFWRYGWRFLPGLVVIPVFVLHLPTDNIVRYAAPLHPWLLASIAIFLFITIKQKTRA